MSQLDRDERELAAGAAVAMDMARQDRRENRQEQKNAISGSAAWITAAFVIVTSVGLLAVMMVRSG